MLENDFVRFRSREHLARILENSCKRSVVGDDGDGFCPPRASTYMRLAVIVGALPNSVCEASLV